MTGFLSEELIDRITERCDLVEIISQYLPLKKAGRNYKGLCPFHQERTPSFVVSPEKQIFHCFGCGVGGNVFSFLQKLEKISFPEAVRLAGEKVGISISLSGDEKETVKENLYQINEVVCRFFQEQLKKTPVALSYLERRKFNSETLKTFRIGYAPSSEVFLDFCRQENLPGEKLREIGLIMPSSRGKGEYAYFRGRIIFPIFTLYGKICGFGGRVLDNSLPKYLNSSQSTIFDKGRHLYALSLSKEFIREEEEAILVEGYTDVLALYQGGIRNVVASLGTSLTTFQTRLLKRCSKEVYLAYDEDSAGVAATLRGIDLLLEADLGIKIISMPAGVDPAEVMIKQGKEAFALLKDQASPYVDYRIDLEISRKPKLGIREKIEVIHSIFPTLQKIPHALEFQDLIKKLAERLNIEEKLLRSEFRKLEKKEWTSDTPLQLISDPNKRVKKKERELLQLMLLGEETIELVRDRWGWDKFESEENRQIAREIIALWERKELSLPRLLNRLKEENLSFLVSSLSLRELFPDTVDKKNLTLEIIQSLKREIIERKRRECRQKIAEYEKQGDHKKVVLYCQQFDRLAREINFIEVGNEQED